jgi:hypothetical protein
MDALIAMGEISRALETGNGLPQYDPKSGDWRIRTIPDSVFYEVSSIDCGDRIVLPENYSMNGAVSVVYNTSDLRSAVLLYRGSALDLGEVLESPDRKILFLYYEILTKTRWEPRRSRGVVSGYLRDIEPFRLNWRSEECANFFFTFIERDWPWDMVL